MDILRLPGPLRRLLLSQHSHLRRHVSTASALNSAPPDPPPTLTLSPSTLNSYLDTPPPTPANLTAANAFFTRTPPLLLYSTPTFRHLPPSPHPEVAFLGRSNVGKSSLLNALFNRVHSRDVAHVSKHAGRTRTLNGYGIGTFLSAGPPPTASPASTKSSRKSDDPKPPKIERWKTLGPNGLICVDMPGYGRVADAAWGEEALKFFRNRRQLRRTFVLIDAEHGVKKTDLALLTLLRREGVAVRVLVSKVDKILYPRATPFGPVEMERRLQKLREVTEEIRGQVEEASGERDWLGDILCFSSRKTWEVEGMRGKPRMGIGEVRWAVLEACGMEGAMR